MGRLEYLPGEVALPVDDALRLACRAGREGDERRVRGVEVDALGALSGKNPLIRNLQNRATRVGHAQLAQIARVGDDQGRVRHVQSQLQIPSSQLLVAGQRDGADPEAGDHRQDPLGPVADQRHDRVAAPDALRHQPPSEPRAPVGDLGEGPLLAGAVAAEARRGRACRVARRRRSPVRSSRRRSVAARYAGSWLGAPLIRGAGCAGGRSARRAGCSPRRRGRHTRTY